MAHDDVGALGHLKVLELGGGEASQLCARLFGDFGADVVKVEPPGGDPGRSRGPYAGGEEDPERSLYFINFNHNKRSVVLDLETEEGRDGIHRLARLSDVVVEAFPAGHLEAMGLDYERLVNENPALIYVSVTAFGHSGPFSHFQGTELTQQALSGVMYIHGDGEARPCLVPAEQLFQLSSSHAFFGALAALQARVKTGKGQHVDVSMQDVGLWQLMMSVGDYSLTQNQRRRTGAAPTNAGVSIYRSRDGGYVQMSPYMDRHMRGIANWLQDPDLPEESMTDPEFRRANAEGLIEERLGAFIAQHDRDAFVAEAQQRDIPSTPLLRISEFADHEHTRSREWLADLEHPALGAYRSAGGPYRMSETPWTVRRPAPSLGQHTDEVMAVASDGSPTAVPAGVGTNGSTPAAAVKPLNGVRIVDFTQAVAGPVATMLLGFMGAEVIKIETDGRPQPRNVAQAGGAELNRNKLSANINAQTPRGYEMALRLIQRAEVVVDNFRPGVMDRMGLGYDKLRDAKRDLIVMQMPGMGRTGPFRDYMTYGQQIFGVAGLGYIWGHPGSRLETRPKFGYTDYVAGAAAAGAVTIALEHRRRTGNGQFIEVAQVEALASTLGVQFLDWTVNGVDSEPSGNVTDRYAPHDLYPTEDDDEWCSIVCRDDYDWKRLVEAMDSPDWATEDRWSTLEGRITGREELDRRIGEWTAQRSARFVMHRLQRHGVPAGIDQKAELLNYDPHLVARESIVTVKQAEPWNTWINHPALPARLSATPGDSKGPAPTSGQHNDYVFHGVMGLSAEEVRELTEEGALR